MGYKFKITDVVKLRSGGEPMTIESYRSKNTGKLINSILQNAGQKADKPENETNYALCSWFEKGELKKQEFDENMLELV